MRIKFLQEAIAIECKKLFQFFHQNIFDLCLKGEFIYQNLSKRWVQCDKIAEFPWRQHFDDYPGQECAPGPGGPVCLLITDYSSR